MIGARAFRTGVLLLLVLAPVSSCADVTPLCDYAAALAEEAQLTEAADAYAAAQRSDEGDCAEDGIRETTERMAEARAADARGRAAKRDGDLAGARTAFRSALRIDRGDAVAAAELLRLGEQRPALPASAPPVVVTAQRGGPAGVLLWIAVGVSLLSAVVTGTLWRLQRGRLRAVEGKATCTDAAVRKVHPRLTELAGDLEKLNGRQQESQAALVREQKLLQAGAQVLSADLATARAEAQGGLAKVTEEQRDLVGRTRQHHRLLAALAERIIVGRPGRSSFTETQFEPKAGDQA